MLADWSLHKDSVLADHCRLIWPCFVLWAYFTLHILVALLAWAQLVSWSSCPWLLRNRRHRWCLRITLVDQLPFADTFSFSGSLQIHLAFASFIEQTFVLQILLAPLVRAHLFFFPNQVVHDFSDCACRWSLLPDMFCLSGSLQIHSALLPSLSTFRRFWWPH